MLERVLTVTKIAFYFALCVLCVVAADTLKHVRLMSDHVSASLGGLDMVVQGVDSSLNDPHKGLRGTLQNVNAILLQVGLASDEARRASREQREFAKELDGRLLDTASNVNGGVRDLRRFIAQTQEGTERTFTDVHNALTPLPPLLEQTTTTLRSTDVLISDPSIKSSLHHIDDITASLQTTSGHVAAMSGDLDQSLHRSLHPSKRRLVLGSLWTMVKVVAARVP